MNRMPVALQRRSGTFRPPTLQMLPVAVTANVVEIRARTRSTIMAVVKADGCGHGAVTVAKAAVAAGAGWLGTTSVAEASALRAARLAMPILTWLHPPGSTLRRRQPPGSMSRSGRWTSSARLLRKPRGRCGFIYRWTPGSPMAAAPWVVGRTDRYRSALSTGSEGPRRGCHGASSARRPGRPRGERAGGCWYARGAAGGRGGGARFAACPLAATSGTVTDLATHFGMVRVGRDWSVSIPPGPWRCTARPG